MFNRTFGFLAGLGLAPKFIYLLEVRGRKSGKIYRSPVNLMEIGGKQIFVAPRGRTQWVRNAEASGEIVLKRASFRKSFALRPIADADKPPLLKEYLDRYASAVKKFFSHSARLARRIVPANRHELSRVRADAEITPSPGPPNL